MTFKSGDSVPYAPPGTVIELLRRYRDRGLTAPWTGEVLTRAGVPDSLLNRTLQTLRLLGFMDEMGNPAPDLAAANRAPEEEYKARLGELLTNAYAEVLAFADPATDSYERVRDAFRGFNPQGQQERQVSLFLGLLEYVGQDISAAARPSAARPKSDSPPRQPTTTKRSPASKRDPRSSVARSERSVERSAPQPEEAVLPPALVGLLRQIPRSGDSWTSSSRDAFLAAFEAVLDFTIRVDDGSPFPAVHSDDADEDGES